MNDTGILIGIGFIIVNLLILGANIKLYTEYFKDRKIEARKK